MDVETRKAFDGMIDHFGDLKGRMAVIDTNVKTIKEDPESLRADMVTKEDLDKAIDGLRVA